jgi:hypothetical protein
VASWIFQSTAKRDDAQFDLVELRDYHLPLFDDPNIAIRRQFTKEHTKVWS